MTNPYTSVAISGYNSSPPPDDGSATSANQLKWSNHKTKLGDPLKNLAEGINSNVTTAFAKMLGNSVATAAVNTTLTATSQGQLLSATSTITVTLPSSVIVGPVFMTMVHNNGTGIVTLDGSAAETINGELTLPLGPGDGALLVSDGTNWSAMRMSTTQALELAPTLSPHQNLVVNSGTTPAQHVDVAYDALTVSNGVTHVRLTTGSPLADVDLDGAAGLNAIDTGSATVSTWYYVWVLWGFGQTVGAVLSASATFAGVAKPTNYTHGALVGAVYNDSGGDLLTFHQRNRRCAIEEVLFDPAHSATKVVQSLATAVPPIASVCGGYLAVINATVSQQLLTVSSIDGTVGNQQVQAQVTGQRTYANFSLVLAEYPNIYYVTTQASGTTDPEITITWFEM